MSAGAAPLRRCCSALILAALSAAVAGAQSADGWVIETVAGGASFGGDGAAATAAQLNNPYNVALDGSGNLYIADTSNHRIRKVDSSGNISTVAGTGMRGFGGDGAAATAAQLNFPRGVALDGAGNLYIADRLNNRIRKVDSSGNISTVAGNGTRSFGGDGAAATEAQLNLPNGVALDGSGNLYIADTSNHRIRKVDSSGNISTVAGSGTAGFGGDGGSATDTAARLNNPNGVALDGAGNLYIADTWNRRIRTVDSSGNISTVAGGGSSLANGIMATTARLNFPNRVAVDGSGNLYIADTNNHRIRKADSSGNISTVAGNGTSSFGGDGGAATAAQLKNPRGVALDGSGNLYIADTSNDRIRKVDSSGNISTVAGGSIGDGGAAGGAQLNNPRGVALDGSGNLYIADTDNDRIRKVDSSGVITTVAGNGMRGFSGDGAAATAARLNQPRGMALDGSGNLYIADRSNHRIRKVDSAGDISTVAGNGMPSFSGDGAAAVAAQLEFPEDVALDGSGNLYIADKNNHRIRKVDSAGNISTVAGVDTFGYGGFRGDGAAAVAAQMQEPRGVALDGSGNLYIADTGNNRIRKVGPPAPPAPVAPPARPRPPEPAAHARTLELSFVLRQDDAPAGQEVVLYAENGDVDFRAQPAQRWLSVEPASGSLEEDEEAVVTVTADPAGLRVGRREGLVYVRSGGRVTARVRVALTVQPAAGPAVSQHGVVNAAALSAFGERELFGPRLLPAAPGSLVVIRGVNFTANRETVVAESFPLPASLGGVTVQFDGLAARLFAVGPQRIEAQLPSLLAREALEAGGTALATVVVETAEGGSYPRRLLVGSHGPGIFTMSGDGTGQAAALLADAGALAAPRGAVGESRPARAGDVLQIYATGLGSVEPPLADGMNSCAPQGVCLADGSNVVLRHTTERPRVSIGGVEVAADGVLFSGLAPTLAAVDMVLVEVPAGIAPSDAAEVVIAIGGRASQPGVTVAVE